MAALGEGEGATILAGASFLWDPSVAPRSLEADVGPAETETQAAAAGGSGWSIESVISWAQSAVLFGDWLPSADLGSDRGIAVAERAAPEPETPQADLEETAAQPVADSSTEDQLAVAEPALTLTDIVDAARPDVASLGDLSAVAALLRSPAAETGRVQDSPEEGPVTAELPPEPVLTPEPLAEPPMRITRVVPRAPEVPRPEAEVVPTLDKVAAVAPATPLAVSPAAPPTGLRYDGFTRALEQPGKITLRLPKPVKRPFSAADLGIDVTPGSSADSLAHMLQRVGADAAYAGQSTKAVAFNDVVDNAAGVRTVRGLYKMQRKRVEQERRSELVDALRDAVPSDGTSLKY